jgi:hypothetical protein
MAVLGLASRTLDVAALFRLVLELAPAGTSWHAVADMGDTVRESAADQPSSSTHTREALGWKPTPGRPARARDRGQVIDLAVQRGPESFNLLRRTLGDALSTGPQWRSVARDPTLS